MPVKTPTSAAGKRYESPELKPKWFLLGLMLGIIALFALGFVLMQFLLFELRGAEHQGAARSVAAVQMQGNDAPPLQPQEGHDQVDAQDLAEMRDHVSAVFDQLGWKWDKTTQLRTIPTAVIEAVRHRTATTQPTGTTSAERGAK